MVSKIANGSSELCKVGVKQDNDQDFFLKLKESNNFVCAGQYGSFFSLFLAWQRYRGQKCEPLASICQVQNFEPRNLLALQRLNEQLVFICGHCYIIVDNVVHN